MEIAGATGCTGLLLLFHDDPNGVNDAGNVTAEGEQDIQPEMQTETDLKENADRRQEYGDENADNVQDPSPLLE